MKNMKRRWLSLLLAGLCALSLTACSNSEDAEDPSTPEETPDAAEDLNSLLPRSEEANRTETLMANNSAVAYRISFYAADGTTTSLYTYRDADRYAYEYEGDVLIDENGVIYGFNSAEVQPFRILLAGVTPEEFAAQTEILSGFQPDENEAVVSAEEENGLLTIQTTAPLSEAAVADLELQGYEIASDDTCLITYTADPDTYELMGFTTVLRAADGTETVTNTMERVMDPETYVPDEQLTSIVFGEETRTVSLVMDPGTEQEATYTVTVGVGCPVQPYAAAEITLYTDAACTQPYTGGGDTSADAVLYARSQEAQ